MGQDLPGFFGAFGLGQNLKRWQRMLKRPDELGAGDLRKMNADMLALRDWLDSMASQSQSELRRRAPEDDGIDRPDQCDWAARPVAWTEQMRPRGTIGVASPHALPGGVTLFHDAANAEVSLRQEKSPARFSGAVFGMVLEIYRFDGSFISFVQDLPAAALVGLTKNHYVTVRLSAELEQPIEIYARLNVQHGPNVEQMVRQFEFKGEAGVAEFDLAYTKINEKRLEKAWLDLIIEGPHMTRLALWDMVMLRAPRADF